MKNVSDFKCGEIVSLGCYRARAEEIYAYERRFDPQPYPARYEIAGPSFIGGLLAGGWYATSIWIELFALAMPKEVRVEGSPGIDELRWYVPVRPGDCLAGEMEVLDTMPSPSNSELILIKMAGRLHRNGEKEPLMTLVFDARFHKDNF